MWRNSTFLALLLVYFYSILHFLPTSELNSELAQYDLAFQEIPPYLDDSLTSLCNKTTWVPNLYLNCSNIMIWSDITAGDGLGLANVRNTIVTCLRWAIDAGMGFIMPKIAIRSKENPGLFPTWDNIDFLFDEDNLRNLIKKECPQLIIYNTPDVRWNRRVDAVNNNERYFYETGKFRKHVFEIVNNNFPPYGTVVFENKPLFGWYFYKDGREIHQSLLNAVQFKTSLVALAKQIVKLIGKTNFAGVHLRVEPDALYYTFEELFSWVQKELNGNLKNISIIYIAVGSKDAEEKFRESMKPYNIQVISKWSLVKNNDELSRELDKLNFDQQAVIDYEALLSSEYFMGCGASSFSYAIAYDRGNGTFNEGCRCKLYNGASQIFVWTY
jgi:hypothetical protein